MGGVPTAALMQRNYLAPPMPSLYDGTPSTHVQPTSDPISVSPWHFMPLPSSALDLPPEAVTICSSPNPFSRSLSCVSRQASHAATHPLHWQPRHLQPWRGPAGWPVEGAAAQYRATRCRQATTLTRYSHCSCTVVYVARRPLSAEAVWSS